MRLVGFLEIDDGAVEASMQLNFFSALRSDAGGGGGHGLSWR
jgi:hypothetical protein